MINVTDHGMYSADKHLLAGLIDIQHLSILRRKSRLKYMYFTFHEYSAGLSMKIVL